MLWDLDFIMNFTQAEMVLYVRDHYKTELGVDVATSFWKSVKYEFIFCDSEFVNNRYAKVLYPKIFTAIVVDPYNISYFDILYTTGRPYNFPIFPLDTIMHLESVIQNGVDWYKKFGFLSRMLTEYSHIYINNVYPYWDNDMFNGEASNWDEEMESLDYFRRYRVKSIFERK
jgi:hypothetical protein